MKILIITPSIPYPLSEGGKVAQFGVIDSIRKEHEIHILVEAKYKEHEIYIGKLQKLWPQVTFHTFSISKNHQKISLFRRIINKIDSFLSKPEILHTEETESVDINIFEIKRNADGIRKMQEIVEIHKFDIDQIDILSYIDLVLAIPDHVKKVFVHHELRFARLETALASKRKLPTSFNDYIMKMVKFQEIGLMKLYDAIFVFSNDDKEKLISEINSEKVYITPFGVLDNEFQDLHNQQEIVEKLVFLGGDNHQPNVDAVDWYINEIMPLVNERKKLDFYIIGSWSKTNMDKYKNISGVKFAGFVENLKEFCKNSIMLVPVRIGSGIRTKILVAMAQGVPVISAQVGCEGILVEPDKDILVANTPKEFTDKVIFLCKDDVFRKRMTKNAQDVIKKYYSQRIIADSRIKCFRDIISKK